MTDNKILTESNLLHTTYQDETIPPSQGGYCGCMGKLTCYIKKLFPILSGQSNNLTMRAPENHAIDLLSITTEEGKTLSDTPLIYLL